ncbi:hypothetical protein POV22_11405 [Klebsiella pneumoniae]|uniref:hypothetical protein n=1 Tax=Klebsiella pneumoniae TaxID=573 RepID=UPI001F051BE8|nr:hypothetical protein [Klebsiella pneumoniae]MCH0806129.1 hypothetical protein [Klebsiella pneumoniae]MCH0814258.1 hypothetical protein [Klebsiella pneumoniae]MCZ3404992.1 hypothetical protein [Klebsiella pneumoniae]
MTNTQLTEKRARLRKAAQDYQSTLSWYQENLDSPNAEQDCDEASAAFKREIGYREMDIIADLLDEIDELQERRKPLQDKDLQGVIDALEHPAGINAAGKQVVRHALVELQERRKAERASEPAAWRWRSGPNAWWQLSIRGDIAGEVEPLYRHAQPAPEKYNIGDATMRHIFTPTGMTNVSDMQAVFDRVEAVLVGMEQPAPVVPDGYVMVPMRLTAENGAKGALSSEFSETKFINCPECFGDNECETCDGSGKIEITVPVTWTTIKEIWAKGVEHFTATPREVKGE